MHALLHAAGIAPPYVLVGHSFGGFNVRLFAANYPKEVAGLALVDSAYEREDSIEMPVELRAPVKRLLPGPLIDLAARAYVLCGYLGLMRAFDDAGPARPEGQMTVEQANRLRALRMEPTFIAATIQEGRVRAETLSEVRAIHSLGHIPMIVLTAGREPNTREGSIMRSRYVAFQQAWIQEYQAPMARLSTRGRQIIVGNSGHAVPVEAPFAVVDAVHELVGR